jgi:hypothetical protein
VLAQAARRCSIRRLLGNDAPGSLDMVEHHLNARIGGHRGASVAQCSVNARPAHDRVRLGRRARGDCIYGANVATAASVSLSASNSPARASSKILMATSSITGVEPVRRNRAHAYPAVSQRQIGNGAALVVWRVLVMMRSVYVRG